MIWLFLAILFSSLLFIIFRLFTRWGIDTFQAIIVNYLTASVIGLLFNPEVITEISFSSPPPWCMIALVLGSLFIGVFYLMAISSQRAGVSVTSVAAKMSLVIPVILGMFLYSERPSVLQWLGVCLSIPAVWLTVYSGAGTAAKKWLLPFSIFISSGIIDALVAYSQNEWVPSRDFPFFSALSFAIAALWGLLFYTLFVRSRISLKNVAGGVLLGIPNYFSIYFLLSALHSCHMPSGVTIATNNIGVVAFSTLVGILLLREKLSLINFVGIALALISIILISITQF